jgi:hypothetical protein
VVNIVPAVLLTFPFDSLHINPGHNETAPMDYLREPEEGVNAELAPAPLPAAAVPVSARVLRWGEAVRPSARRLKVVEIRSSERRKGSCRRPQTAGRQRPSPSCP